VNNVVSVIHEVNDLAAAENFFLEHLGFTVSKNGREWVHLENGALDVRLRAGQVTDGSLLRLIINCSDLDESLRYYSHLGFDLVEPPAWSEIYFQQASLRGPYNLWLTLVREYNEDELDIVPELPISIDWKDDALMKIRQLLKSVPVSFRHSARLNVTEMAEAKAVVEGQQTVDLKLAMRTLVQITPEFQHDNLKAEMHRNQINPDEYFVEN
jgi:catechol 2,3-dioxygenase-like lactoylglutathione lyase family enzyme